jgi:hypothetical protein
MSNTVRHAARLGFFGAVTVTASLVAAPSAHAITWYADVPTQASSVTTVASQSFRIGASGPSDGTVQVRKGKYNGAWYLWGRVASPSSKVNSGYELQFTVSSIGCKSTGTKIKDINTTTYTAAARVDSTCKYFARVVNTSTRVGVGSTSYEP